MQNALSLNEPIANPAILLGPNNFYDYGNTVTTCRMNGDSMQPTIEPGEVVAFVDCGGVVKVSGIYVFTRYVFGKEVLFIKRVQPLPNGELIILSDNKAYETFPLEKHEQSDMVIYGRVVASLAVRRFV